MGKIRENILQRNETIGALYAEKISGGMSQDLAVTEISKSIGIGKFYVRSILKDRGVEFGRKEVYDRKDGQKLAQRNADITEMVVNGIAISQISKKFRITETRVRQIAKNVIVPKDYEKLREEIESAIKTGSTYADVIDRYGKNTIKTVKLKTGFSAYRAVVDRQNNRIVKLYKKGKSPGELAETFSLTKDNIYTILKKKGIKKGVSSAERKKRNMKIVDMSATYSPDQIALKYKLSSTMVRIILAKSKRS